MRNEALLNSMKEFLLLNGTDSFAKLISDTIDESRPNGTTLESLAKTRERIANKLIFWNKFNMNER